jgi:hypothetical protein
MELVSDAATGPNSNTLEYAGPIFVVSQTSILKEVVLPRTVLGRFTPWSTPVNKAEPAETTAPFQRVPLNKLPPTESVVPFVNEYLCISAGKRSM